MPMTVDSLVPAPEVWNFPNPPVNHQWHLFYIEAEVNPDDHESTILAWLVSAQGADIDEAMEHARNHVMDCDDFPRPEEHTNCGIQLCEYINSGDEDVFRKLGELK